jgi:DNA processing protein
VGLIHWLQLSLTTGLGPVLIRRLIDYAGSPENACAVSRADLQCIEGIGQAKSRGIHQSLQSAAADAEAQLRTAEKLGASLICPDDETYPALLRSIPDPPPILYILGQLEPRDLNALAMVGSRRCSYYGREQAERLAALLAGAGFTVISGGARGIDSASHRGALQHPHGRTLAVLGSGLDVPYPPENTPLFQQIVQRGAVISEFPFGTPPNAENFPRRNRIVSGMSRGVLVVEADQRSGALITARLANEDHGRPVFALPGRVDNPMSLGPHQLIRDGAILVTRLEDVLDGLHPFPDSVREPMLFDVDESPGRDSGVGAAPGPKPETRSPIPDSALTDRQRLILSHLSKDPTTVDQIIDRTALDAAAILREITFLSLKGIVRRVDGQSFVAAR